MHVQALPFALKPVRFSLTNFDKSNETRKLLDSLQIFRIILKYLGFI